MALELNSSSILHECARIENLNLIKPLTESEYNNLLNQLNDLETVEEGVLAYTEEMVNVSEDSRGRYLIELDNLAKYIYTNECTVKDAVSKICEHYDISVANTYVVIESVDQIMNDFKQTQICSESADSKIKAYGKEKINGICREFDSLLESGVKLLTKESCASNRIY